MIFAGHRSGGQSYRIHLFFRSAAAAYHPVKAAGVDRYMDIRLLLTGFAEKDLQHIVVPDLSLMIFFAGNNEFIHLIFVTDRIQDQCIALAVYLAVSFLIIAVERKVAELYIAGLFRKFDCRVPFCK